MATDVQIGYGCQFWLHNGTALTKLAEVMQVSLPNEQVDEVEATHMESPNRTREYVSGLIDPGEITLELNYIAGSTTDTLINAAKASGAQRDCKIVVPAKTAAQAFTFKGIVKGYERNAPIDDRQTATVTIRIAGAVTQAADS
jgi:predicted secreted protein